MKAGLTAGGLALAAIAFGAAQAQNSPPRQGATAPTLAAGKESYAKWCTPCHGAEPELAGTLALRTKYGDAMPAVLEDRIDLTPETVAYFVRNGVAWMAPFRKTEISDAELAAIGAYLSSPLAQRGVHAEQLADEMMREQGSRR
jgi:mono/diheme cytochrome c family protein